MYSEFEEFIRDAEFLVTRKESESFDYVEGFVFSNTDDAVNGWPSVPLDPENEFNPLHIPQTAGSVLYCLEVAFHYCNSEQPSTVNTVTIFFPHFWLNNLLHHVLTYQDITLIWQRR